MKTRARRIAVQGDPIRDATISALNLLLEPLIELMFDAGVTVHAFNTQVRERAVHVAMQRLRRDGNKQSNSRAAIITGLPRSEIAKILRSSCLAAKAELDALPVRRILAAWNDDPRFLAKNGTAAVLPIFGWPVSFEQLVNRYGGGIPVRAMLDELTQMQAIDRLSKQRVKMRKCPPTSSGLTHTSIANVGERCRDLLQTLAHNRNQSSEPLFQETATSDNVDLQSSSFLRGEISQLATNFVEKVRKVLNHVDSEKTLTHPNAVPGSRLGVTVYFFEDNKHAGQQSDASQAPRKNLRRRTQKSAKQRPSQ